MQTVLDRPTELFLPVDACWQAVLDRDAGSDGTFVFAVRSTGIYCRPSCPARRPARDQVVFFPAPEPAEQAGFRACRRCRPQEAAHHAELVERLCRYIEAHADETPDLEALSAQVDLSKAHLQRIFKRKTGVTPREYADACRLNRFKARLQEGETITNALYEAGYGSSSRLYERAPARLGMTPRAYRSGGKGMQIGYTLTDCPLGRLLVAATEKGICAVRLGDSDAELEAALRREFPQASVRVEDAGLETWVAALRRYLRGEQPDLDLPLDVQATAFQWRVWTQLQAVPYGSTRSYGQIAAALGQSKAVRAVARACATNPVALIVPCHRIVRENGALGGYRWGIERKQALLAQEKEGAERTL